MRWIKKEKNSKSLSYISTAWKFFIKITLCSNIESTLNISSSRRYSLYHQTSSRNHCKYVIRWFISLLVRRSLWFLWPNPVIMVSTRYRFLNTFHFQLSSPIVPRNTLCLPNYVDAFFSLFRKYDHSVKK